MLWGALDWQHGSDNPYTTAQTVSGGPSALPTGGGIGVRRAVITIDRSLLTPADDAATMHFDFLNITGGAPDDTWTTADYSTLETILTTYLGNAALTMCSTWRFTQISWYRHGPGVVAPNPAQRVFTLSSPLPGNLGTAAQVAQVSSSITFRTAVRKSWGRTYLPFHQGLTGNQQRPSSTVVDNLATPVNTMIVAAAAADFRLVVVSNTLSAALNVEKIEVDDVLDIVRRRRLKHTSYRKILP